MDDKNYYHASQVGGLSILKPHISNHGVPLVYLSKKRENVLVYLSNAIEKYCKETGFAHDGNYEKWGPYGFNRDGKLYVSKHSITAIKKTKLNVTVGIFLSLKILKSKFLIASLPVHRTKHLSYCSCCGKVALPGRI
ncbi:MAG: hypothetical protein K5694_05735 [Bacilli bacterium]|nr:hypothetical protein [Bacilli bacterium]